MRNIHLTFGKYFSPSIRNYYKVASTAAVSIYCPGLFALGLQNSYRALSINKRRVHKYKANKHNSWAQIKLEENVLFLRFIHFGFTHRRAQYTKQFIPWATYTHAYMVTWICSLHMCTHYICAYDWNSA